MAKTEKPVALRIPNFLCAGGVSFHAFVPDPTHIVIVHHRHQHPFPSLTEVAFGCTKSDCIMSYIVLPKAPLINMLTMAPDTAVLQ